MDDQCDGCKFRLHEDLAGHAGIHFNQKKIDLFYNLYKNIATKILEGLSTYQHPTGMSLLTGVPPEPPSPWIPPELWSAGRPSLGIFQSTGTVMTNHTVLRAE